MAFKGWPDSALAFYEGLEADNSKAYWLDHKEVYERDVKAPMDALLAELTAEFGETKLFRPYRDTRFSRDKSPYKTTIAATIGAGYVRFSADGLFAGGGMYHMLSDQLARFRKAVDADKSGKKLEQVVATVTKSGLDVHAPEELKTAPKGYPKDHPRIDLLRMKGIVAARSWQPGAWLQSAGAKKRVVEALRATKPLLTWLEVNVGPSTESES
ncbi:MAG TPA: DUF2461 domain-containing protein [Acidimicrobiales bacterium]|jgi:uncharacterized protein (TIGR02453 family)|nr:DUF2461 domain-containing protein [Acidimicrobiales bacterium]